jgi:cytochrome b6
VDPTTATSPSPAPGAQAGWRSWWIDRLHLAEMLALARKKQVPIHPYAPFYYLGGMTLFFFAVQVATGILLMLYYRPSASEAFESVEFIMTEVRFGWLIRSLHSWSANLMVYFAFVHLFTAFFMKAYRPPREITWVSGSLMLFLVLAFGFSGYLLPWNQLAYFATKVGTDIAGEVPFIGDWLLRFLRGGSRVTGATLSRFYGWHVAILPALTTVLLVLHLVLVQVRGMSVPPRYERRRVRGMPFFPHFALRDLFGWTVALGVLGALAALFPWELGEKADPFAPAFPGIRPEWYFMFMFETLKLMPGGEIFGIGYEAIPILLFGVAGLALVLVPFLDRGVARHGRSPGFTAAGALAVVYITGMTAWGYRSWVPVAVVAATAALILVLGIAVDVDRELTRSLERLARRDRSSNERGAE